MCILSLLIVFVDRAINKPSGSDPAQGFAYMLGALGVVIAMLFITLDYLVNPEAHN